MMTTMGFRKRLAARQQAVDSLLCVGLDPLPEKLPGCLKSGSSDLHVAFDIARWMEEIVDATAQYASMFKPQKAHWEAFPHGGLALQRVVSYIKRRYPDVPVFLDCKRGDIGRTQQRYQIAHFEIDGVDGMNFSPYMGEDCMEYLVNKDFPGRAIVGLCYTSNLSGRQTQDVRLADGRCYWEFIAQCIMEWAEKLGVVKDAGLVMAAAWENPKGSGTIYSQHLTRCREIVGNKLWFLIPGIGTQGGFARETVREGFTEPGSIAVNSSSDVIFASDGEDFADAAAQKARETRNVLQETVT